MLMSKPKAVLVCSGGLDSTTLLYEYMTDKYYDVYPLNFNYGQKHAIEQEYLEYHLKRHNLEARAKSVYLDLRHILKSALLTPAMTIPNISDPKERTREVLNQTVVPFRNAMLLSIAVGYALSIEANHVAYGAQRSDYETYYDTRPEFVRKFNELVYEGTHELMYVQAPYVNMNKAEVLKVALQLKVPINKTWSCYRGGKKHCGNCPSCVERKNAFKEVGVRDPTIYAL